MRLRTISRLHVLALVGGLLLQPHGSAAQSAGAAPDKLVHDDAHVMQPEVVRALEQRLVRYADSTGVELAVVTVASLHGQDIAQVGDSIKNAWGIGNKQTQRGILYLIAPSVPRQTIRTGRGIEADLPDALCFRILKQSQPTLRQDPQAAILSRVAGIQRELAAAARRELALAPDEAAQALYAPTTGQRQEEVPVIFWAVMLISLGALAMLISFVLRTLREQVNSQPTLPVPDPSYTPPSALTRPSPNGYATARHMSLPPPANRGRSGSTAALRRIGSSTPPNTNPTSAPSSIGWGSNDDDTSTKSTSWGATGFGFGSDDSSSSTGFNFGGDTDTGGGGASSD